MERNLLSLQLKTYSPLVAEFCSKLAHKKQLPIYGPFLPNCMQAYATAKVKVFYVGQDTYYWIPLRDLLKFYRSGDVAAYIKENNSWLSVENISKAAGNNPNHFWTFVRRLHLQLKGESSSSNVVALTQKQKAMLEELGWGNLNSIEKPSTLRNEGLWGDLDQEAYWNIKNDSRRLDTLKCLLDVFQPDIVFILNWDDGKEEDAFKGLSVTWNKSEFIEDLVATYKVKGYRAKIIWTRHPGSLKWVSIDPDELIEKLIERVPAKLRKALRS
jgi:hypothetical protein